MASYSKTALQLHSKQFSRSADREKQSGAQFYVRRDGSKYHQETKNCCLEIIASQKDIKFMNMTNRKMSIKTCNQRLSSDKIVQSELQYFLEMTRYGDVNVLAMSIEQVLRDLEKWMATNCTSIIYPKSSTVPLARCF